MDRRVGGDVSPARRFRTNGGRRTWACCCIAEEQSARGARRRHDAVRRRRRRRRRRAGARAQGRPDGHDRHGLLLGVRRHVRQRGAAAGGPAAVRADGARGRAADPLAAGVAHDRRVRHRVARRRRPRRLRPARVRADDRRLQHLLHVAQLPGRRVDLPADGGDVHRGGGARPRLRALLRQPDLLHGDRRGDDGDAAARPRLDGPLLDAAPRALARADGALHRARRAAAAAARPPPPRRPRRVAAVGLVRLLARLGTPRNSRRAILGAQFSARNSAHLSDGRSLASAGVLLARRHCRRGRQPAARLPAHRRRARADERPRQFAASRRRAVDRSQPAALRGLVLLDAGVAPRRRLRGAAERRLLVRPPLLLRGDGLEPRQLQLAGGHRREARGLLFRVATPRRQGGRRRRGSTRR